MRTHPTSPPATSRGRRAALDALAALLTLAVAHGLASWLDPLIDLANLAMLFVLAATAAAFWLPSWASALFAVVSVALFNWSFVPPRGSFEVGLHQHLLLLGTLLIVSLSLSTLMGRLRQEARRSARQAREACQLQQLGETLRSATDLALMADALQRALAELSAADGVTAGVTLMLLRGECPAVDDDAAVLWAGSPPEPAERIGLWLCLREAQAFGAGMNRHSELPGWYLPIPGPQACWGAALLRLGSFGALVEPDPLALAHALRLCELTGQAMGRLALERRAAQARAEAETQALRSALLTAISHDFRTPLASILGAASALEHQSPRIGEAQRQQLLTQIQDEARALTAMADNTLQLVRLESGQIELSTDWESPEELAGMALARVRRRDPQRRIRARIEPGLPLLRVDAPLLLQLIENLLDNALKYSDGPVDLVARRAPAQAAEEPKEVHLLLAVKDRGPGIAASQRERLFRIFQRGEGVGSRRGAGLGLAVCRAIAGLHGGELTVRNRSHGGSSFELTLPCPPAPQLATLPAMPEGTTP